MSNRVDREAKIIRGYSVMSLGEATGHGMIVDETTLDQLATLGSIAGEVKTRVQHPNAAGDGFGRFVGKSKNFRREGSKVVADLHLSPMAFSSPAGDLGTYLMDLADAEPDTFGASPEVQVSRSPVANGMPRMRVRSLGAVAIVDDPATNRGFFACLSVLKEPDMPDTDPKVAELTAERDLLAEEVARLKADNAKIGGELTAKSAELSVAKAEAATLATKEERARVADVIALCAKAGKAELSAKHIADGTATGDVQKALFDVLCSTNKPVGDAGGTDPNAKPDENDGYRKEYAANTYLSARMTVDQYIASRRIDDHRDPLISGKAKAA